jgi:hypothetical protein
MERSKQMREMENLELNRETIQDLAPAEAEGAKGGLLARTVGDCAGLNVPTGLKCPHITDFGCGQMLDAEKVWDTQDNLP